MAVTLQDLIAEVESFVYSYFNDRDKVTSLTAALSATALTVSVAEADQVDRGFIEIDDELIAVKSKDNASNVVTVHPWGRGQRGSVAAAHSLNARVAVNPRFPRAWIKTEINTAIANLYPDLWRVGTDASNKFTPAVLTYPLPADAQSVLQVLVDTVGPSKVWQPARRYHFNYNANTTEFPTGRTITLLDSFAPGSTIQVVYRQAFGQLATSASTLDSVGCDDSWRDLIKLQVAARMIMSLDSSRLQATSVEATNRSGQVPTGSAVQVARQLLAQYAQRLDQERHLLLNRHSQTISVTR